MPRKSNRRELLINIATTRFLISGYDVVTVDELCELSSSTKGSFYHFFTNKEALAVDVVNQVWHETENAMEEIFHSDRSVEEKLAAEIDRIASGYIRYDGKRHFVGCPVGTLAVSLRGKSMKLTRRLNFAMTHMLQFYVDAYQEGIDKGAFSPEGRALSSEGKGALSSEGKGAFSPEGKGAFNNASTLASRFQLMTQGLSTLGKAQSNVNLGELADNLKHAI